MKKNYLWKWLSVMMVATLGIFITSCKPDDPELSVSTTDIRLKGTSDYQKIAVTARHTDWTVEVLEEGRDWITAGKINNMVNVSVKENPNKDSRKGSIQISATEDAALYHIIYVTQEGGSTKLSVSPENVSFSASGGEQNIQVTCNTGWSVRGGNDWLTVEKLNQKTIALSAKKNESSEKLETTITVSTDDGEGTKNVKVSIAASEHTLTVSGLDAEFDAAEGNIQTAQELEITCNSSWTISGKPDWLSIDKLSGTGSSKVKVWPNKANTSADKKEATLTIKSANKTATKKVVQRAGKSSVKAVPINTVALYNQLAWELEATQNINSFHWICLSESEMKRLTEKELLGKLLETEEKKFVDDYMCFPAYDSDGNRIKEKTTYYICTVSRDEKEEMGEVVKTKITTPAFKDIDEDAYVRFSDVYADMSAGFQFNVTKEGFCDTYHLIYGCLPADYNYPGVAFAFEINYYLKYNKKHWLAEIWALEIVKNYPNNHTFTYYTSLLPYFPLATAYGWGVFKDGSLSSDLLGFKWDTSQEQETMRKATRASKNETNVVIRRSVEEARAKKYFSK